LKQLALIEARELSGVLRWIVCLLACINELPRDVRPVATRPGKRPVGLHMLPYLRHSNLSLRLPRDNRVVWAPRQLDKSFRNAQRAQHGVMGHWRVIERGKSTHICRHLPTMVEEGVGICERCEMLVRWIDAHTRGDPALGIVEHTYDV